MSTVTTPVPQTVGTKMIPVARPSIGETEERAVLEVLRSGWITQGPRVGEFESAFSAYIGCRHAVAVSSCTTALQLALLAQGIGPGDEVICPSLSFIATANSIASTGATPIFCDIDLATYNLDPELVEGHITNRTRAILVVHQVGLPAEMNALSRVAGHYGIPIIEDAACAIGSSYEGNLIGRPIGRMACFSFHPRKILTTGEGGMITTNELELAGRLRRLRQHAMSLSDVARHNTRTIATETYDEVGYNYRMTDMQAAIGLVQLARVPCCTRQLSAQLSVLHGARRRWLSDPARQHHAGFARAEYLHAARNHGHSSRAALPVLRMAEQSAEYELRH
jgi:perosamine synthetase